MKKNDAKQLTSLLAIGYLMLTISNSFAVIITNDIIANQEPKESSTASAPTPSAPVVDKMDTEAELRAALKPATVAYSWPSTVKTFASFGTAPTSVANATTTLNTYADYLSTNTNMGATYFYAMAKDVRDALEKKRDIEGDAFQRVKSLGSTGNYRFKNDAMREPFANFLNKLYTYLTGLLTYNKTYPLNTQKNFDGSVNNTSAFDIHYLVAEWRSNALLYHAEFRLASTTSSLNTFNGENKAVNQMKSELRNKTYAPKALVKGSNY